MQRCREDEATRVDGLFGSIRRQVVVLINAVGRRDSTTAVAAASRIRRGLRDAEAAVASLSLVDASRANAASSSLLAIRATAAELLHRVPKRVGANAFRELYARASGADASSQAVRHISDIRVIDADLRGVDWDWAHLAGIEVFDSDLTNARARNSHLDWCQLSNCAWSDARLDGATIADCAFDRSVMDRSSWRVSRATRVSFVGARLVDAVLSHASFTDCEFRAASLAIVNNTVPDAFVRVEFTRCDLRATNWDGRNLAGMRFVDCKMYGLFGTPRRLERVEIERPDLSPAGDGSQLGNKSDVIQTWKSEAARTWGPE